MASGADQNSAQLPPHPRLRKYYADETSRRTYLNEAFDVSAKYYDRLSQLIGLGTDRWYRRQALLRAGLAPGMSMLDVGCGTGLSAAVARDIVGEHGHVFGVEPSRGMLFEAMHQKRLHAGIRGVAEFLPLADNTFDFVCMSFALRHVAELNKTFQEFTRVLKPGGTMLIMEMTPPEPTIFYQLIKFYLKYVIPLITRLMSRNEVVQQLYIYCWETHDQCVAPDAILAAMEGSGLDAVKRWIDAKLFSEYTAHKRVTGTTAAGLESASP